MECANRVGVCDPVPMFRNGLRSVLREAEFIVDEPVDPLLWAECNYASSLVLALQDEEHWDLLDSLGRIPTDVAVIALLPEADATSYREALRLGAISALPRHSSPDELLHVVLAAAEKRAVLPIDVVKALAAGVQSSTSLNIDDEQMQWLRELAKGVKVDDLAWRSGYSRRTMFRRLHNVYRELGVTRREEALLEATRRGLL